MYKCKICGETAIKPPVVCRKCNSIESYEEILPEKKQQVSKKNYSKAILKKLKDVDLSNDDRILCGISEVDRVMGGGFVSDSVNIITAPPGQGKSTLLLAIANALAFKGKKVLYVSSEESAKQVKGRAKRILTEGISDELYICDTKETNDIKRFTDQLDPDVLIIDSISSFRSEDIASPAGSLTQVRNCSDMIINLCKGSHKDRMAIIVAHVTKDDELSGARSLEHDVDAVMYLEGEKDGQLRILHTYKNRFGELDTGLFIMTETGLKEITNADEYFTTKRDNDREVNGVALTMVKEGSRSVVVEVEALTSKTFQPYPTRIASCLRKDNFNILLSIIEQKLNIPLFNQNAVISTTGRIKLSDSSSDLAIILSILSSIKNKPLSNRSVFLAEVGLTGELKRTVGMDKCIRELDRLNYDEVYVPYGDYSNIKGLQHIKLIKCKNIKEVADKAFL